MSAEVINLFYILKTMIGLLNSYNPVVTRLLPILDFFAFNNSDYPAFQ